MVVTAGLTACGTADVADEQPVNPAPTLPGGPLESEAPSTTAVPSTTVFEQSTTDLPTTTTQAPTTTTAAEPESVDLELDGVGPARFGDDAEVALAALTALLGEPNDDSGWVPAFTSPFGVCPGVEVRGVRWGPLRVLFGDQGTAARTMFTWVYASGLLPAGEAVGAAGGLQTPEGIGLGSSIADLELGYPEVVVSTGIYGPTFDTAVFAGYAGTISSDGIDGFVTSLVGGAPCGE
jgi:hypothetical protein